MRGVNKAIIVGNVGRDPETRYLQSGSAVTEISVATSESWKDKSSGEKQERTEWHRVTFFGKLAEIAAQYLRKGSQVYVEGKIQTDKWQDKEGNTRYSTKIVAGEMQMLGSRPEKSGSGVKDSPASTGQSAPDNSGEPFDDSIPF